jgi:hypothetical protein
VRKKVMRWGFGGEVEACFGIGGKKEVRGMKKIAEKDKKTAINHQESNLVLGIRHRKEKRYYRISYIKLNFGGVEPTCFIFYH